jgi:DNA-binding MarR family transcriptional regulator
MGSAGGSWADDPERQADAVMRAARVLVGVVAQSVAEVEDLVSLPQLRVLVLVAGRGSLNLGEVAEALGVHASNATRIVDRLVVAGLLHRSEHPADRRYLSLELTDRGHEVVQQVMAHRRAAVMAVMEQMTAPQRRALARTLETFAVAAGEPPHGEEEYLLGITP